MKKFLGFVVLVMLCGFVHGQNPVSWSFTSKKIADKTFELHLTADIQSGWHIYSQQQPDDAIAIPTDVKFTTNPLLTEDGKVKEVGNMEKFKDTKLSISANQYSEKVDFVQIVKVKSGAKTNVSGTVEFQTCNDKKCLPPKTVNFNVTLN
ncbi:MAG TPA: protein-disulfide reductase DsbD domain-containing protein [Chitinophagaceae bacterium]